MKINKQTYLIASAAVFIGIILILCGIFAENFQPEYFWRSLLLNTVFFTIVSLFGTSFYAMHILANAKWIHRIQIVLTSMGELFAFVLLLYLVMFFKLDSLFDWVNVGSEKSWYLNIPFFVIRNIIILGGLALLASLIARKSDTIVKTNRKAMPAIFLVFLGVSFLFYAYDWIVSLDLHWYSALFGWYLFTGLLMAGISATVLLLLMFDKRLKLDIDKKTFTYLGKYLFAFSMIWAYLWYVQFLLVWYVNKPDEAGFYTGRLESYSLIFYAGFVFSFVVPFVLLLANHARGIKTILLLAAISGLVGQWFDKAFYILPLDENTNTSIFCMALGIFVFMAPVFVLIFKIRNKNKLTLEVNQIEEK